MAWTAKIFNTTYSPGFFSVTVEYANGTTSFTEAIDMTGGEIDTFHRKVASRLNTLEVTEALNANFPPTGDFTPVIPEPTDEEKLRIAVNKIRTIKDYQDLGIIPAVTPKETTQDVLDTALADAQAAFDPAKL